MKGVTEKQIRANRSNALLSTGAKTIEGKNVVARNAIKHGLRSQRFYVIEDERYERL